MTRLRYTAALLLGSLPFVAGAAEYDSPEGGQPPDRARHRPPHHGPSVERAAMHRLLAKELAARSGRPAAEISALLKQASPPEVAEDLGLEREALHEAFTAARRTLIQRMQQAQLINAEEAEQLRSEQPTRPRHSGGRGKRGERGEREIQESPEPPEN